MLKFEGKPKTGPIRFSCINVPDLVKKIIITAPFNYGIGRVITD